jgi:hypothetical protein
LSDAARLRTVETRLAAVTLAVAAVFAPLETFVTVQMFGGMAGIVHPGFVGLVVLATTMFALSAYLVLNAEGRAT